MSGAALASLLPMILLAGAGTLVLLLGAFGGGRRTVLTFTVLALLAAAGASLTLASGAGGDPLAVPLLVLDGYTYLFTALLALAAAFVAVFYAGEARQAGPDAEMPASLLLFSVLGAAVLVGSRHFAALFLGLETLTVSLYPLIATRRRDPLALEAAVKYLILASLSSGLLLFGAALVFAEWGTLDLEAIAYFAAGGGWGVAATAGMGLLFAGFAFKLAVVPFHLWTPDVYQGSSTPITAFLATASKGAVFLLLLRFFTPIMPSAGSPWFELLYGLAVVTMTAGNLLALFQEDLKRMLAFSSIAHVGYMLMAPLALAYGGAAAGGFYIAAYFLATLAAFGAAALVFEAEGGGAAGIGRLRGLAARRPLAGLVLSVAMFSLAGIPLTAGFMGKFFLFGAAIREGLYKLAVIAVLNSGVSIYYYLRVVVAVYMREEAGGPGHGPAAGAEPHGQAAGAAAASHGSAGADPAAGMAGVSASAPSAYDGLSEGAGQASTADFGFAAGASHTGPPATTAQPGAASIGPTWVPLPLAGSWALVILLVLLILLGVFPGLLYDSVAAVVGRLG